MLPGMKVLRNQVVNDQALLGNSLSCSISVPCPTRAFSMLVLRSGIIPTGVVRDTQVL